MKPRKITMQAFGAYINRTVVDFTPLYADGIFLITGPTGCGKTTILDAMSFALYGRASGTLRDVRDMRSTAAPDSLETAVEFEFELDGKIYCFERERRFRTVKHRSGTTDTELETDAACYDCTQGRHLICTGTDVDRKAEELMGFSHEQFSQVVVLPQGEFRRLLTANSTDKQKILEVLFGTSKWQLFVKALSDKSKSIENELIKYKTQSEAILSASGAENAEALRTLCTKSGTEYAKVCTQAETLNKALNEATVKYNKAVQLCESYRELDGAKTREKQLECEKNEIEEKRGQVKKAARLKNLFPILTRWMRRAPKTWRLENSVLWLKKPLQIPKKAKVKLKKYSSYVQGMMRR